MSLKGINSHLLVYNLTMDLLKVVITTVRLKLVPTAEKYSHDIFKEFTAEITKYMFPKPAARIKETLAFIKTSRKKMASGEEFQVVVLNKDTGEFLGHAGIRGVNTSTPELGVWIKKSAHGNKYGKEAIGGLKKWIDKNINYTHIKYPVERHNVASRKIAEALGGVVKAQYPKTNASGRLLDEVEYHIFPKQP